MGQTIRIVLKYFVKFSFMIKKFEGRTTANVNLQITDITGLDSSKKETSGYTA